MKDLSELNLNHLLALEALLAETNVTRAADRLGVTQPTMSRSLQRLREHLGDELLVRSGRGLVRTPRAERIHESLRHGLQVLRLALREEPEFVPSQSTRAFTIAANDVVGVWILPALMAHVRQYAPGVSLNIVPLEYSNVVSQLDTGAIDMHIGVGFADAPGLKRRTLLHERWICLARKEHPSLGKTLDLPAYVGLAHALCSPRNEGAGVVDEALAACGYSRKIAFKTCYFIVAAMVVAQTDLILTMPRRSGLHLAATLGLSTYEPPIELPDLTLVALWHERVDDVPAHRWLRQTLFSLL